MNSIYSNKYNKNFSLRIIPIIIFLFSFSLFKSQENGLSSEKALLNETLTYFNNTKIKLDQIKELMSNIKYNIILIIKHKDLIRAYNSISSEENKIQTQLNENNYDKNKIMEEIYKLNRTITKFDLKCSETMRSIKKFDKTKKIIFNMIKIFFIILLVIIIVVLLIIGIVSFFVIRSQRRYHILHEEHSQDNIEDEKHHNNELDRIKEKNSETDSDRKKISSNESNEDKKTEVESSN